MSSDSTANHKKKTFRNRLTKLKSDVGTTSVERCQNKPSVNLSTNQHFDVAAPQIRVLVLVRSHITKVI